MLQLKPEGNPVSASVSGGAPAGELQQVSLPVDQKILPHDIVKVGDNMVPTQV